MNRNLYFRGSIISNMVKVYLLNSKKSNKRLADNLTQLSNKYKFRLLTSRQKQSADIIICDISDPNDALEAELRSYLTAKKPVLALVSPDQDDPFAKTFNKKFIEYYYSHHFSDDSIHFILSDFIVHIQKERRRKGKLIVIDGGDGSGKGTQSAKLIEFLHSQHVTARMVDFPQYYNSFYGRVVARFLRGEFGSLAEVSPYLASFPYASDRASIKGEMDEYLALGGYIIANRYATSNLAHQSAKFANSSEREKYLQWDYELEYKINKIPKESIVLYLYVPWKIGLELTTKKAARGYLKGRKQDIAEEDINHRIAAEKMYLELCKRFNHWVKIDCVKNGEIMPIESIHSNILSVLKERAVVSL